MKVKAIAIAVLAAMMSSAILAEEDHHVVFIHGLNSSAENWKHMAQLLRGANVMKDENWLAVDYSGRTSLIGCSGVGGVFWEIFHWTSPLGAILPVGYNQPIEGLAQYCGEEISEYKKKRGARKIDFVVHSMGGLILRTMVRDHWIDPSEIGQVITLATPHYGQDNISLATQVDQMDYGSEFMWDLANNDTDFPRERMLCVVGDGDHIVDYYAAVFNGASYVKYVDKSHCATRLVEKAPAICECDDDDKDEVLGNVSSFILTGKPSGQGRSTSRNKNRGGIMLQVVDGRGNAVAYSSPLIVTKAESAEMTYTAMDFIGETALDNLCPDNSKNRGIVYLAHEEQHGLYTTGGLKPGSYKFTFSKSKDMVFGEFTTEKTYEILDGRTTVVQISAENVRPLDYVFLIDTTGSMGSHINSVKSNAKNLIETQLLNGARDCRVAVVDYRDFPERTGDSRDYAYDVKCKFTSDATTAMSAVNSLSLGDGGDGPETVYSGIHACIVGKGSEIGGWRDNSVKTIMIMGDARPLDPEPITGYTKSDVVRWANELKTTEDDEGVDIDWKLKSAGKTASSVKALASVSADDGGTSGGISIYPVVTSSSLTSYFSEIAEETGGKVVSASSYASVADAVKEVIEQSVAANGFEFETVTVNETAGSVTVRVFGGSESDMASIGYQVVSGSAVSGVDFTASSDEQRLSWAEGERSYKEVVIPIAEDSVSSLDKFFSIVLCNPVNMGLGGINVCRVNLKNVHSSETTPVGDVYLQCLSRQSEMGTVSGSGYYNIGDPATLTASANDGYVFTSWENGDTARVRAITVAEAYEDAVDGVATYVASFCSLDDLPLPTIASPSVVTSVVGETVWWRLDYYSISEASVTCDGLPSGLSFSDDIVSGEAKQVGKSKVIFTVTNAKGVVSKEIEFVVVLNSYTRTLGSNGDETSFSPPTKTTTYNVYFVNDNGFLAGTMSIKVNKAKAKGGGCATTVTIQALGGKKQTIKGTISTADGSGQGALSGLSFSAQGVTGTLNGYRVEGAIDTAKSKDANDISVLNGFKGKTYALALLPDKVTGVNAAMVNGVAGFSVAFAAKGKTKVTGNLPDGTKVSVSSQLIVGSEWCCLPVIYSKKSSLAFMLWFDRAGNFDSVSGMTSWKGNGFEVEWDGNIEVMKVGNLSGPSRFNLVETPADIKGAEVVKALLPQDVPVTPNGTKWDVPKADKVKLDSSGQVSSGANPSALKLSYTAKTGMFKGSFSFYTVGKGRLNKNKATITGVVINGVGYGTAAVKGVGCWPVKIE